LRLSAHPNPTAGTLRLEGTGSVASMHLVDLKGHVVQSWGALPAVDGLTLDLGGVAEGVYVLQAQSMEGVVTTVRVVVQR